MKKKEILLLLILWNIFFVILVKGSVWDLSTIGYDNISFNVASQDITPKGVFFNNSGNIMYITGDNTNTLYQYFLSTAWDISTSTYNNTNFSVASQDTGPNGVFFNNSGNIMYMIGFGTDTIYQYSLSTPWDVSTATYNNTNFSVASQDNGPNGFFFNSSGNKLYIVGETTDTIYQYSLSTPWDVSTASYDSISFSVSSQDTGPTGFFFKSSGDKLYIVGENNDRLYQYSLSTAWNISTASYDSISFSISSQDTIFRGIFFNSSGNKIYIAGNSGDSVYQYSLDTTPPIINVSINNTSPRKYDLINITANITDNIALKNATLRINFTTGITITNYTLSGTSAFIYNITNITDSRGNVLNISWIVADSSNFLKLNFTLITVANTIPKLTNVSITPLPLQVGDNARGHANYTDADSDVAGGNQTYWYINKTIVNEANNSFTLGSGNITLNSNITFSARYNDTYEWSNWGNSSIVNVGDASAPVLNNCTLQFSTLTDASGNTNTFNCTATDASSNIETMSFDLNGTLNKSISFSFSQALSVSVSYIIFESLETLKVGSYSIMNVTATDTSSNKLVNSTNFHFTVTSAPSGGSGTSGGGGGITTKIEEIIVLGNLSLILKPPLINTYLLCGTFKHEYCAFSIILIANKVIDSCMSSIFKCEIISNNTIRVSANSSNSSFFIKKVFGDVTLIDKAQLAKTIPATVRFINIGYALPFNTEIKSTNYALYRLENGTVKGIRLWFVISLAITLATGFVLYRMTK